MKTRIEFNTISEAVDYRHKNGGRIAWENNDGNRVYWYSYHYTHSQIIHDLPKGSFTIQ